MECQYEIDRANNLNQVSEKAVRVGISVVDLNDDCLLKLLDYLDLVDVTSLRFTCKRFCEFLKMAACKFKCFKMNAFARAMKKRGRVIDLLHLDNFINYIAPVVELIDITDSYFKNISDTIILSQFTKYEFPKLKSLAIKSSSGLDYIKNRKVEELTVLQVSKEDLNHYSWGIKKVKRLTFGSVESNVPISELILFFESNPNIESLKFINELQRKVPADFYSVLTNLKKLDLLLGVNFRDVEHILQIENLTELALEKCKRNRDEMFNITMERVLTSFIQKQTLKSLELRNIYFEGLASILAQLNLETFRFVSILHYLDFNGFNVPVPFPKLKHLYNIGPIDNIVLFKLIEHLTALEDIQYWMIRPYDKDVFLQQLSQLLAVRRARPELRMSFPEMPLKVKINFTLGCYEMTENHRSDGAVFPHA